MKCGDDEHCKIGLFLSKCYVTYERSKCRAYDGKTSAYKVNERSHRGERSTKVRKENRRNNLEVQARALAYEKNKMDAFIRSQCSGMDDSPEAVIGSEVLIEAAHVHMSAELFQAQVEQLRDFVEYGSLSSHLPIVQYDSEWHVDAKVVMVMDAEIKLMMVLVK